MTPQQIRAAVAARPDLQALADAGPMADFQAIADALSVGLTRVGNVGVKRFLAWTAQTGLRAFVEDTAANPDHPLRASSLAVKDVLVGAVDGVDFSDPGNLQILGAWVGYGAITQAQADQLIGYATTPYALTWPEVKAAIEGGE
jgi:hypothetical protein